MSFVLLIFFIISFYGFRVREDGAVSYLSPQQTSAINGIFVMLVFLSHFAQYIEMGEHDKAYILVNHSLDQMIVTTFLFYSGYGIMRSIIDKNNYIQSLPLRVIKLLLHFDIAILLYLILDLMISKHYSLQTILCAFVGWTSVGNSNWYIFAMLSLYLITYISGIICKDKYLLLVVLVIIGCVVYVGIHHLIGRPRYCYDTIMCFSVGLLFGLYTDQINALLYKTKANKYIYLLVTLGIFLTLYIAEKTIKIHLSHFVLLELRNIFFPIFIVSITVILIIGNKILEWLGKHIFEIYILQRIPMIALRDLLINRYIYFFACAIITIILSIAFRKFISVVDNILFKKQCRQ